MLKALFLYLFLLYPVLSRGDDSVLRVHLFVMRTPLVQTRYSTLGESWAIQMKFKVEGQNVVEDRVLLPMIEDGSGRLQKFENEFPETKSHFKAKALSGEGHYMVWDTENTKTDVFQLDIPTATAANSIYAQEEIDGAVTNSTILFNAVQNQVGMKILPVIYGASMTSPFHYSYLVRSFLPQGVKASQFHSAEKVLSQKDESWLLDYEKKLAEKMATLNYIDGIYIPLSPQFLNFVLDENGSLKTFIITGSKNVTVDNFMRLAQNQDPLRVGKRTPQMNRYHYYYRGLSQSGENIAGLSTDAILVPGLTKTLALSTFLKKYMETVKHITGVSVSLKNEEFLVDSRWSASFVQNYLGNAIQEIYNEVVEAKRPVPSEKMKSFNVNTLRSLFEKKYLSSEVAFLEYQPHYKFALETLKDRISFAYDPDKKMILAFERENERVLAIAYNVNQNLSQVLQNGRDSQFSDLWSRGRFWFRLASW